MTYTIYHIPGIKIGCSVNPNKRVKKQGYSNYEVLEIHHDVQIASIRERELQKKYGYKMDVNPYSKTLEMQSKEASIKGGITQGNNNKENMSSLGKQYGGVNVIKNITFQQAEEIRQKHTGKYGDTKRLAEEYGIYKSTVSRIIRNQLYSK